MKTFELPNTYLTEWGVERKILHKGRKYSLEEQSKGSPFIIRERLYEYSDAMMGNVEYIPRHYERFETLEAATEFFEKAEGATV